MVVRSSRAKFSARSLSVAGNSGSVRWPTEAAGWLQYADYVTVTRACHKSAGVNGMRPADVLGVKTGFARAELLLLWRPRPERGSECNALFYRLW
jgi:hypothetical protein